LEAVSAARGLNRMPTVFALLVSCLFANTVFMDGWAAALFRLTEVVVPDKTMNNAILLLDLVMAITIWLYFFRLFWRSEIKRNKYPATDSETGRQIAPCSFGCRCCWFVDQNPCSSIKHSQCSDRRQCLLFMTNPGAPTRVNPRFSTSVFLSASHSH
jgi:hypothetical protein